MNRLSFQRFYVPKNRNFSTTMQAVVMREFGEPSVMKVETISRPVSEKGKCVIQLHACGVNPVERIFFLIIY
jgi:hypothetical protein